MRSEFFEPFYIPAGPAGTGAIKRVKAQASKGGTLKLAVVSGGPVFLFRGEVSVTSAYRATHGETEPDFDAAASANGECEITLESAIGGVTLHSDNETIGYLQFKGC